MDPSEHLDPNVEIVEGWHPKQKVIKAFERPKFPNGVGKNSGEEENGD